MTNAELKTALADHGHEVKVISAGGPTVAGGFDGITVGCSCSEVIRAPRPEPGVYRRILETHYRKVTNAHAQS